MIFDSDLYNLREDILYGDNKEIFVIMNNNININIKRCISLSVFEKLKFKFTERLVLIYFGNYFWDKIIDKYIINKCYVYINIFKLIYKYPKVVSNVETINNNLLLKIKLYTEFNKSLFISEENMGIIGICGHIRFDSRYLKYLDTITNIYIISSDSNFEYYTKLFNDYKHKIIYIKDIDVGKFLIDNPNLNAYYRYELNLMRYFNFDIYAKITNNIYLGDMLYSLEYLRDENINCIINVADDAPNHYHLENQTDIELIKCPISERKDDYNKLFDVVEIMHEKIKNNKKIYIHCRAGVNRSPSIIILYLMKYENYDLYDAYLKIAKLRLIWTMPDIFNVLYNYAMENNKNKTNISPIKMSNHIIINGGHTLYALYEYMHLNKNDKLKLHRD